MGRGFVLSYGDLTLQRCIPTRPPVPSFLRHQLAPTPPPTAIADEGFTGDGMGWKEEKVGGRERERGKRRRDGEEYMPLRSGVGSRIQGR